MDDSNEETKADGSREGRADSNGGEEDKANSSDDGKANNVSEAGNEGERKDEGDKKDASGIENGGRNQEGNSDGGKRGSVGEGKLSPDNLREEDTVSNEKGVADKEEGVASTTVRSEGGGSEPGDEKGDGEPGGAEGERKGSEPDGGERKGSEPVGTNGSSEPSDEQERSGVKKSIQDEDIPSLPGYLPWEKDLEMISAYQEKKVWSLYALCCCLTQYVFPCSRNP